MAMFAKCKNVVLATIHDAVLACGSNGGNNPFILMLALDGGEY